MRANKYSNKLVSELLKNIAAVYKIQDANKFRFQIAAYERAADSIDKLGTEAKDYYDEGKLENIPGVGKSIAKHLADLYSKGKSDHFSTLLGKVPKSAFALMKVPGIGPKKAYSLAVNFKIGPKNPLETVLKLAEEGEISKLGGFGEESQSDLIRGINEYKKRPPKRLLLSEAQNISQEIVEWMKKCEGILKVDVLGSLRRKMPTVGDIDISVATKISAEKVFDHFTSFPKVASVIERGEHSASILVQGIQVDLLVQPLSSYGSLLQHFTGSKMHNVHLREYAIKKGLSLSEYGIKSSSGLKEYSSEEEFYNALGLSYIPPELREGRGEIYASQKHSLPNLVGLTDIKGDLQVHSSFDIETSHDLGQDSMKSIVKKALSLGYEYVAFTEHNPSQKNHTQKDIYSIIKSKKEYIEELNYSHMKNEQKFKAFNSLEIDILPNGDLPVSPQALELLDFALVSIHSSFNLSKDAMTQRVLKGLSHPKVKIFAHPTARLLNARESVELNWDKIFDFCRENDKWIEINADPRRLDLPDFLIQDAIKNGVTLTLGTDAHSVLGLNNMEYGVAMARRGWAEAKNIANTRDLTAIEKMLK